MKISIIFLFLLASISPLQIFGHESTPSLSIEGSTQPKSGDIISLTIKVSNPSSKDFQGKIKIQVPPGMVLLNTDTISVHVTRSNQRFYPIKVKLDKNIPSGTHRIQADLLNLENQRQDIFTHTLQVQPYRLVTLQVLNNRVLMHAVGDSVKSSILIRNLGNIQEEFKIIISTPTFSDPVNNRKFREISMILPASKDTTIQLGFVVLKPMMDQDQFTIQISGVYSNQDIFGSNQIVFQNASSRRVFRNPEQYGTQIQNQNQLSVVARNLLSDYPYFSLYGNGTLYRNQDKIDFNLNLNQASYGGGPLAYNTWFRYDHNNKGITLGNLNENSEKYLFGRGAKIHFGDSAQRHLTEVGFMDKSYSLFDPLNSSQLEKGFSAFVTSTHELKSSQNLKYYSTVVFDRDPYEFSESWLYFNSIETIKNRDGILKSFKILLGGGINRAWNLMDNQALNKTELSTYHPSLSGGANLHANWKKFNLSSSVYTSGGYYPGNKRGTTQINQRISRKIKNINSWLEYNYNEFEPKYNTRNQYFQSFFMNERSEVGLSSTFGPNFSVSAGPRYEREKGLYFVNTNIPPVLFYHENARVFSNVSWQTNNAKFMGNLLFEGGINVKNSFENTDKWHNRTQINLSFYKFQLTGNYQSGIYHLTDFVYNTDLKEKPSRFSATLNWNQTLLERRLFIDLNSSYYKDKNFGENRAGQARVQWNIFKTQIFMQGQIYSFRYNNIASKPFYDIQFGLTQKFNGGIQGRNKQTGNLKIRVFQDLNKNGIFDQGDQLQANKSVLIGNTLFFTDQNGMIEYKKLPYRQYRIQTPVENGWYYPDFNVEIQTTKSEIDIPLSKSTSLRGKIILDFDPIKSLDSELILEGYSITAISKDGKSYRTKSDSQGHYLLFLPEGEYTIHLIESELPTNLYSESKNQYVVCEVDKINEAPDFILRVKEKEIEIKRFGKGSN